jgi:two-component system response regulator
MTPQGTSILLVEDNEADEHLTIRALRKGAVANEIVVARDGEEALMLLLGDPDTGRKPGMTLPGLVLLDLKLPKIDGIEVLRAIRANPRTKTLPVVIVTSSDEDRDLANGYGLGANSYVRKPIEPGAFMEAVSRIGMYWLIVNMPPPPG